MRVTVEWPMRVLSLMQPFATLIVRGLKRYEVRSWKTPYRGRIAIHASSKRATWLLEELEERPALAEAFTEQGFEEALRKLPRSAVVGAVDVVDIVQVKRAKGLSDLDRAMIGKPRGTDFLWVLANPHEFAPVPIKGKLNLWTLPGDVAARVTALDLSIGD